MTSLWESAVRAGDADAVRAQVAAGADVNARDQHGQTGLMVAAHGGHEAVVRVLLEAGAQLDASAKFGLTALMLAVVAGHETVALLLAEAGADLRPCGTGAPGFAGKTAHDLAAERGMQAIAARLALRPRSR